MTLLLSLYAAVAFAAYLEFGLPRRAESWSTLYRLLVLVPVALLAASLWLDTQAVRIWGLPILLLIVGFRWLRRYGRLDRVRRVTLAFGWPAFLPLTFLWLVFPKETETLAGHHTRSPDGTWETCLVRTSVFIREGESIQIVPQDWRAWCSLAYPSLTVASLPRGAWLESVRWSDDRTLVLRTARDSHERPQVLDGLPIRVTIEDRRRP